MQTSRSERVTPHQELENGERKRMSFSASCTLSERMFPAIGRKPDEKHVRKPFVWKGLSPVALQAFRYLAAIGAFHRNDNPRWSGTDASFRKDCPRWSAAFSGMYRTQCLAERSERPTARIIRHGSWHHQRRFHLCSAFPPRLSAIVSATLTCLGTLVGFMRMERSRLQAASIVNRATVVQAGRSHGNGLEGLGTRLCELTWGEA